MNCCVADLFRKEVINVKDGTKYGYVCDVEVDVCSGTLVAIIVYGRPKIFGIAGREEDIRILWKDIAIIGDDIILVNYDCAQVPRPHGKAKFFDSVFK